MGALEIEILQQDFQQLLGLLASIAPNPFATLEGLGPDRLISNLTWVRSTPFVVGVAPVGFVPELGTLTASAPITVTHVSIDELDANPLATGTTTTGTAWVGIFANPSPPALHLEIFQIDVPGAPSQRFTPPTPLYTSPIAALETAGVTAGGAVLLQDGIVTLRFTSKPADNPIAAPRNLLSDRGGHWLIRLTPELLIETVLKLINDSLTPPPKQTTVEQAPTGSWTQGPAGEWYVQASVGIKKVNACPAVAGGIDVSVTIDVTVTPSFSAASATSPNPDTLHLDIELDTSASNLDVFKCWAGTLGLAGLPFHFASAPWLFATSLATLADIGNYIVSEAGQSVAKAGLGPSYQEVTATDTTVIYTGSQPIPVLPAGSLDDHPVAGPDGIVVGGQVTYPLGVQAADFSPDGPSLRDTWLDEFDCQDNRFSATLIVEESSVTDTASIPGARSVNVPVTVFQTSVVRPTNRWTLTIPAGPATGRTVTIVPNPVPDALGQVLPIGTTGRLFFHTSAGIRRYDIDPVPAHTPPSEAATTLAQFKCHQWVHQWTKFQQIKWLVDPPEWDYGERPLRQWSIVVDELPAGDTVIIHQFRNSREYGTPIAFVAPQTGGATIEIVTDDTTELSIEHSARSTPVARLAQRWLLPISISPLDAQPRALTRTQDNIVVATVDRQILVDGTSGFLVTPPVNAASRNAGAMPPYSLRLSGGRVAAVWDDKLVIAVQWGST